MPTTTYRKKQAATGRRHFAHEPASSCALCSSKIVCKGTARRQLISLQSKSKATIQIRHCSNVECMNHGANLKPAAYLNQIVPESGYGVDVYCLIGHLRLAYRQTIPEIHKQLLKKYPHIEIGERHVENLWNHLSLCIEQSGKNAAHLKAYFADYSGLVLSLDGIEPEKGHSILYIVREVQSGKILFAHYCRYADADHLGKEILLPLQQVLQQADLPVLGWIADKELAIGRAVQEVFKNIPFQHCQSHFLGAMKKPLTTEDTKLGKAVKKNFGKIKPLERAIDKSYADKELTLRQKEQLDRLCSLLRNWLNISMSHKHRFKGVELYESVEQIKDLIPILRKAKDHEVLRQLDKQLNNSLADLQMDYEALQQGQVILAELADLLYGTKNEKGIRSTQEHKEKSSPKKVKKQVTTLLQKSHKKYKQHSPKMRAYLRHFQNTYDNWKENLFTCYEYPYLPNDNNRLELSHSQMKKQYRRITGQKSTAKYLKIHGEQAAFLLAYAYTNNSQQDLIDIITSIDQQQLKEQKKEQLLKSQQRGRNYTTKARLDKTLHNIKELWCEFSSD